MRGAGCLPLQAVGGFVGERFQPRAQGLDAAHPEGSFDEVTQPAVIRLVAKEHVGRQRLQRPRQPADDRRQYQTSGERQTVGQRREGGFGESLA